MYITFNLHARLDDFTGIHILSSKEYDAEVDNRVAELKEDPEEVALALGSFPGKFAELMTAEGEARAQLNDSFNKRFAEIAEKRLADEDYCEQEVEISEEELLDALRNLTPTERAELAIKIAAL